MKKLIVLLILISSCKSQMDIQVVEGVKIEEVRNFHSIKKWKWKVYDEGYNVVAAGTVSTEKKYIDVMELAHKEAEGILGKIPHDWYIDVSPIRNF